MVVRRPPKDACERRCDCCSLTGQLDLLLLQQYWIRQEAWSFFPVKQLAEQFMQSDIYQESMQASHWYACWSHCMPDGCSPPGLNCVRLHTLLPVHRLLSLLLLDLHDDDDDVMMTCALSPACPAGFGGC